MASTMFWPCETRTSTCRNFATISSGLYRFLAIAVLLDVKDIPQVGPLQWGWISSDCTAGSGSNLYGRLIGRLNRPRALPLSEHLGPSGTGVIAHENRGCGVAGSIWRGHCGIKSVRVVWVSDNRADGPIGKAGAPDSRYLSEACATIRAAKQSTGILLSPQSRNFEGPGHHHAAAGANPNHALICERRRAQRSPRITSILRVQKSILQTA